MAKATKAKKSAKRPAPARKTAKKVAKKTSKKPASRSTSRTAKKTAKKVAKKPAARSAKKTAKPTTKKAPKKPAARKTVKKTAKKVAKKPTTKTKAPARKVTRKPDAKTTKKTVAKKSAKKAADPATKAAKPRTRKPKPAPSGLSFLNGKPGSSGQSVAALEDKPKLSKTKLLAKDLRHFRQLLETKRRQLLGDMSSMEKEALQAEGGNLSQLPVHMADMGTDNYEQEFTLTLVDRDRKLVDEIDHALRKIDEKTYGICEGTGQMITKARLEAQPWARYSIEYAKQLQRPGGVR
ncbi:MAG: TraR/DksA family transcriptional regulator [Planctomycetota bacterium]